MIVRREDAWTRRSEDPRTVLGWIFRPLTSDIVGWVYLVKTVLRKRPFDPATMLIVLFYMSTEAWNPAAEAHGALPTLTDGTDALPVTLTVFDEEGQITGRDRGWVAFAEGWLVYEGLRADFSLTKASIGHPTYFPAGISLRLSDRRRIELTVLTDPAQTSLPAHRNAPSDLRQATRVWLQGPTAEGDSSPPPRRVHPEVVVERLAFRPAYALLGLFLASLAHWWGGLAFSAPLLVAAAACLLWFLTGLWRFWRALPSLVR